MNGLLNYRDGGPGHYGVGGSVEAAKRMAPVTSALHAKVLSALHDIGAPGATGDELAAYLKWEKHRVRPRTAELKKAGKIVDSLRRRPSETGIMSIVWVLPAPAGEKS